MEPLRLLLSGIPGAASVSDSGWSSNSSTPIVVACCCWREGEGAEGAGAKLSSDVGATEELRGSQVAAAAAVVAAVEAELVSGTAGIRPESSAPPAAGAQYFAFSLRLFIE